MKSSLKIAVFWLYLIYSVGWVFAAIPSEYNANYKISWPWDQVNEAMVKIEALRKTGTKVPPSLFSQLNSQFQAVFQYLPQTPNDKLIYEQCRITSQKLSTAYTYDDFNGFYNQCYTPLLDIINTINAQSTVKANIAVSPPSGSAPHNVTLDARASIDPSQDTIPNENFYWYFSDVDGVQKTLGVGPVINHTFNRPGKYIIHLTARSVNWNKWVFDGETTAEVNVSPQSAVINIYANGKRMKETTFVKLWTTEALNWVVFDGTSTAPTGGRRIISHRWDIASDNFNYTQQGKWDPTVIKTALPGNGQYTITLTTFDNENNQISSSFPLVVSDPVATIKATPDQGTTSTHFIFDGWNSYAVSSKLKTYKREVYDPDWRLNDTIQARQINKQFSKPWLYTVKLTVVDELGQSNIDQYKLYVESTQPVPQYAITATQQWDRPSQFILDASPSSDIDQVNGDNLSYEWKFDNPNAVKVDQYSDNKQKAIITVNQIGIHNVTLTVRDSYGKYADITKQIKVDSTLRPSLTVNPVAAVWGQAVNFSVKTNKPALNYEWDLGDGNTHMSQFDTLSHTYTKVGIYPVTLTVTNDQMESNTIHTQVFIWEINKPVALYQVSSQQNFDAANNVILPIWDCDGKPAYLIDRYQNMFIDASMSVNTKGQNSNLNIYFKPKNDKIVTAPSLKHQFAELGCQSIDLTVQDQAQTTQDKKTIYFKVRNSLPKIGNISVSFPQYGNEAGIWFFNDKSSDPSFETFEPLVVRLTADNTVDPDGYISYYTWYYYKADDPDRILDLKITPGNTNTVTFALSREAGEYVFGVKLTDNDDENVRSESVIGKGPVIFLKPKWGESGDIPIVTMKSSQTNAKVGETVTFTTNSKLLSSRDDFIGTRVFKYDFDGDGVDDLTTKLDEVTHTYTTPSSDEWYKPKVKVLYRGKVWVWYGDTMIVKKWLKPNFIYQVIGKKLLITDLTLGADKDSTISYCMNMKYCNTDTSYIVNNQKSFIFDYPTYGKYIVKLEVKDSYGNVESMRQIIDMQAPTNPDATNIVTLPQLQASGSGKTVTIGKALDNTLSIYVAHGGSICSIDTDWSKDSNGDGNSTNDKDLSCNALHQIKFDTIAPAVSIAVITESWTMPIQVSLIDNQTSIAPEYNAKAQEITSIVTSLSTMSGTNQLQQALLWLRANLGDTAKSTEYVIDIQNLTQWGSNLDKSTSTRIQTLLAGMKNASSEAAQGWDKVAQAQAEILALVDDATKKQLQPYFEQLNAVWWNKDQVITQLTNILWVIKQQSDNGNFDPQDYEVVKKQICDIASYRDVAITSCGADATNPDIKPVPTTTTTTSNFSTVLKYVIIGIVLLGLIFVWAVVYFALKARKKQQEESEKIG
jgi:PKD repeat protein